MALLVVLVANMLYAFKIVRVGNLVVGETQSKQYTTGLGHCANLEYAFKTVRVGNLGMGETQSGQYTIGVGPTTLEYPFWGVRLKNGLVSPGTKP